MRRCADVLEPYQDTGHSYTDALLTAKLGLGYLTGVIEFFLGAIFYVMCLPIVRKSGYFQVSQTRQTCSKPESNTFDLVILLVSHVNPALVDHHAPPRTELLEMADLPRRALSHRENPTLPQITIEQARRDLHHGSHSSSLSGNPPITSPSSTNACCALQVIHLVINKPRKFTYKPGDYIYINIPAVANFEWHPFSISSAPEHKGLSARRSLRALIRSLSDSLWLHVRASGHWTRRVYDLFRMKLQQDHGYLLDENNHIHLRTSMRSRMSRTYISELRGSVDTEQSQSLDMSKAERIYRPSLKAARMNKPKSCSLSLPPVRFQTTLTPSCHSSVTLYDHPRLHPTAESVVTDVHTTEENDDAPVREVAFKQNNRLTVPPVGDYCLRVSNSPSANEEQPESVLNDSRISDALGYLRMYECQNRVQINTLQFNDREDLQVRFGVPRASSSRRCRF